ncbi:PH domain-containing protein [Nocardioides marmoraquaticus]
MAISPRLLNDGESVVVSTRTHVKALLLPALTLVVVAGLAGFLLTLPSGEQAGLWRAVVAVVAVVLVLWRCAWPFVLWLTTTYTFTDRRLITREGVLTRRGHDISLSRISDISYEKDLLDRVLGCGTLVVSDAGDLALELHDIPRVEEVQRHVSELLHQTR